MRDEIDARLWAAHHEDFSSSVDEALRGLQRGLGKIEPGRGIAGQLLAIGLAASFSLATLGSTIA